jgi:hypothetical protein
LTVSSEPSRACARCLWRKIRRLAIVLEESDYTKNGKLAEIYKALARLRRASLKSLAGGALPSWGVSLWPTEQRLARAEIFLVSRTRVRETKKIKMGFVATVRDGIGRLDHLFSSMLSRPVVDLAAALALCRFNPISRTRKRHLWPTEGGRTRYERPG